MSMNRTMLFFATAMSALGAFGERTAQAVQAMRRPTPPPAHKRTHRLRQPEVRREPMESTGNLPHQSLRERARRQGGETWRKFKEADRIARGLPPKQA